MPSETTTNMPRPGADARRVLSGCVDHAAVAAAIGLHESVTRPRLAQMWSYYRNPAVSGAGTARARLAQERGLPARFTGKQEPGAALKDDRATTAGREVVIENDIAWRIHTMVDFMFGRPLTIVSTARDEGLRREIERALDEVWERSGGIGLLTDIGLLGHVYGHIDLIVRAEVDPLRAAANVRIEPIDPLRGIPLVDKADYRRLAGYVVRTGVKDAPTSDVPPVGCSEPSGAGLRSTFLARWLTRNNPASHQDDDTRVLTEIITGERRWVFLDRADEAPTRVVESGPAFTGGAMDGPPIVHIQNISQPFHYTGLSEVEPLIPLQNELNTRLSDRANRVTLQSFKMYLAKGLETSGVMAVGPGQVWATDNPDASVTAFGGDGASPSEESHITEIREAMDKTSGVPPLASGVVRAKIGNLTSENALRVTLMGLLSKTARKHVTYGRGIAEACGLVLRALNDAGVLKTEEIDRGVRIEWPDPLPREERAVLDAAKAKLELGVARERVLSELGYAPTDPGVV